jgi:dihydrofolate reductase
VSRRLVVTENVTLNGVVENDGSWFDPTDDSAQGRQLAEVTREHAAASDGFLVGRVTFEEMRGFWPQRIDDTTGVTSHLDQVEKYVVSRTIEDPDWDGTTVLRGGDGLLAEIRELTQREGSDIVLTGSISLAHDLLDLDLVDELRLFVYPVIVSPGRRLLDAKQALRHLTLAEARTFDGGVVLLRYTIDRTTPAG